MTPSSPYLTETLLLDPIAAQHPLAHLFLLSQDCGVVTASFVYGSHT